jgi:hypothetical protein
MGRVPDIVVILALVEQKEQLQVPLAVMGHVVLVHLSVQHNVKMTV